MSEPTMDKAILRGLTDSDAMQDDLAKILLALGLGDHARPKSPHQVVITEVLPAIERLMRGSRAQQTNEIQNSTVNQPVVEKQ